MAVEELNQHELTQASRMAHPHAVYYQSQFKDVQYEVFNPWSRELRRSAVVASSPISVETATTIMELIREGRLPGWFVGSLRVDEIAMIAEG